MEQMRRMKEPVINCRGCEKKIKMQFCPECGAFYSVTFSNIQPGNYKYSCKKCGSEFIISIPVTARADAGAGKPAAVPEGPAKQAAVKSAAKEGVDITFMRNSINTFTAGELLSLTATSFSLKKIIPSAAAALLMLLTVRIALMARNMAGPAAGAGSAAASFFFGLLPAALCIAFYTLSAAVVSKITLERIFYNREPSADEVISFAVKKIPGLLGGSLFAILLVNIILVLFGRIPMLGPLFFALAFLPVYLLSAAAAVFILTGIWFYPPLAAHREGDLTGGIKNLFMFVKKHNLGLLYMVPVVFMLTAAAFAAIFAVHSLALSLVVSVSKAVLMGDAPAIFSGIPAMFIKISESALAGANSSLFRELSSEMTMVHHAGGLILGVSLSIISVLLISLLFSITGTVSTHVYIMMERGLTVDDKRKALTLFILFMLLALFVMLKKML